MEWLAVVIAATGAGLALVALWVSDRRYRALGRTVDAQASRLDRIEAHGDVLPDGGGRE